MLPKIINCLNGHVTLRLGDPPSMSRSANFDLAKPNDQRVKEHYG